MTTLEDVPLDRIEISITRPEDIPQFTVGATVMIPVRIRHAPHPVETVLKELVGMKSPQEAARDLKKARLQTVTEIPCTIRGPVMPDGEGGFLVCVSSPLGEIALSWDIDPEGEVMFIFCPYEPPPD